MQKHLYTVTADGSQSGLPPVIKTRYIRTLDSLSPTQAAIWLDVPPGLPYGPIVGGLEITGTAALAAPTPLDEYYLPLMDTVGVHEIAHEVEKVKLTYGPLTGHVVKELQLLVLDADAQIRIYRAGSTGRDPALRCLHWTGNELRLLDASTRIVAMSHVIIPTSIYSGVW